jgi:hypothetical protein
MLEVEVEARPLGAEMAAVEANRLSVEVALADRERLLGPFWLLGYGGHRMPAGTSFIASPDPTPMNARPG